MMAKAFVASLPVQDYPAMMETVFDWLTVAIFCGIAVLFLQRSTRERQVDRIWHYIPPSLSCIIANQLGNHGYTVFAALFMVAAMAYVVILLKPFEKFN